MLPGENPAPGGGAAWDQAVQAVLPRNPVSPQPSKVASALVVCTSRSGCPLSVTTLCVPSLLCSKSTPKKALAINFLPELECLQKQVILAIFNTFSLD